MSLGNVDLTLGLNTSPATQGLQQFYQKLNQSAQKAAGAQKPLESALNKLTQSAKKLGLTYDKSIGAFKNSRGAVSSIEQVQARVKKLNDSLLKTRQVAKNALAGIGNGFKQVLQGIPQGIGLAIGQQILAPLNNFGAVVGGSVKSAVGGFVEIDKSIRQVLSITGESSSRFDSLSKSMNELAAATKFTAGELSEAAVQLARAGFSADEIEEALPGIAQGAAATGEEIQSMGNTIIQVLGGFQKGTSETAAVVDTLTAAANNSNTTVTELGEGLKYVAPVAKSLGLEFNDVAAAAGLLANSGIKASQMGTSLRSGLGRLAAATAGTDSQFASLARGTGRMSKVMKKLAVDLKGADGGLKPLPDTLKALKGGFDQLGSNERDLVAKILFGDEAKTSWISLLNQNTEEIDRFVQITNNASGVAAETAGKNLEGISGKLDLLRSAFDSASASIGKFISVGLKPIVEAVTAVLNVFNSLPESIQFTMVGLVALTAAIAAATAAWALFNAAASQGVFAGLAGMVGTAATSIGTLAVALNKQLGVALVASAGKVKALNAALWSMKWGTWGRHAKAAIWGTVSNFDKLLIGSNKALKAIRALTLASMWGAMKTAASNALVAITGGFGSMLTGIGRAAKAMKKFVVASRGLGLAALAVGAVALAVNSYMSVMQEANDINKAGDEINKDFAKSMAELGVKTDSANTAWERSVERVGGLQARIDLFRNAIGLATAEEAELNQASIALGETFDILGNNVQNAIVKYIEKSKQLKNLKKGTSEYMLMQAELEKIEGKSVETIEKSIQFLVKQKTALLDGRDASKEFNDEEAKQLSWINDLISGFESQKKALDGLKGKLAEAQGGYEGLSTAAKSTVDQLKEVEEALTAAKQGFKAELKAMGESFNNLKTSMAEGLKTEIEGIKAEMDEIGEANNAFAKTKDAEIAAAREQAKGVKDAISEEIAALKEKKRAALESLSGKRSQIRDNLDSELGAIESTRSAASKRHDDDISGANRAHSNAMANYSRQLAAIDKQKAAVASRYDSAISALGKLTPAELKLAAIERQRLQAQARQGGEEGLRARAQLERAAQDERVAALQVARAKEIEALEEKAEKKRRAQQSRTIAHQSKLARLKEAAAEKDAEHAEKAKALREEAAEKEKAIEDEMAAIKNAAREAERVHQEERAAAEKEHAATVKKLEQEKAEMAKTSANAKIALEDELDGVRQKHEGRLKQAEIKYNEQRQNMLRQYNKSIGESGDIIVRTGDTAWGRYADNAIGHLKRVKQAAANAAKTGQNTGSGDKTSTRGDGPPARPGHFAGGPVTGGTTYTVNELGQEAFLSRAGRLSMINAPAFGHWKAPGAGTVIPAHITKDLGVPKSGSVNVNRSNISGNGGSVASSAGSSNLAQLAAVFGKVSRGDNITNNVTIQSENTTQAASDMMVELTKIKRRRFNR